MRGIKFLFTLFIVLLCQGTFGQKKSVEIWIRVFIPSPEFANAAEGNIKEVPENGSIVRIFNLDFLPQPCLATDNRGFSDDCTKTSRIETRFTIHIEDNKVSVSPAKDRSLIKGITKLLDCETGKPYHLSLGVIEEDILENPTYVNGQVRIKGKIKTRINILPFLGDYGAPSIDYEFEIYWSVSESKLKFNLNVGNFPANEVYARIPDKPLKSNKSDKEWITVFQNLPLGAPWSLIGENFGISNNKHSKEIRLNAESSRGTRIKFNKLLDAFPTVAFTSREDLFNNILKGDWPNLIPDTENYENTCAMRLSVALNQTRSKITKEYSDGSHSDGDGNFIAINVPTMKEFLTQVLGESNWGMSKESGRAFDLTKNLPAKKGIILYTFPRGSYNAFGHVDLWNGLECISNCPKVHTDDAVTIELWELD